MKVICAGADGSYSIVDFKLAKISLAFITGEGDG